MDGHNLPRNFQEWQHCITVDCGLELTPKYISERIAALQNEKDHHTRRFVELYGRPYLEQVLTWFKQAESAVAK